MEKNTPFFAVKTLITRLLEVDNCKNIHDREQLILEHVKTEEMRRFLPLLNDLLGLKVRPSNTGNPHKTTVSASVPIQCSHYEDES